MPVLLVGGTGRSGTTVVGRLLGTHPDWVMLPSETKFISGPGGLCDLARGAIPFQEFSAVVRGRGFQNEWGRGLHMMADAAKLETLLPKLRDGLSSNPWAAAADFVHALLDPIAIEAGAKGWVDTSPTNVAKGVELLRMFPNTRIVHMVRDGRDVALSVTRRRWGSNDPDEALEWWGNRLERLFVAAERVPEDRLLTVQMEDLFVRDREREFRRLLEFTGLTDDPAIRTYFEEETTAKRSHAGRWRKDLPPERLAAFEARHDRFAAALLARGRPYRPVVSEPAPEPVATS